MKKTLPTTARHHLRAWTLAAALASSGGALAQAPTDTAPASPTGAVPDAASVQTAPARNPVDPFEPFNRGVFRFNKAVDDAVLKPVATTYRDVVPSLMRSGVTNFFSNLGDVWNFANNVFMLKGQNAAETFMRLNVNTFFGLGGLLDVATDLGIERHGADFGQTLGYWGVPAGPYLMLPLLGPSTVRDTAALPLDWQGDPVSSVNDRTAEVGLSALRIVDKRARYLRTTSLLEDAALDPYSFVRDAYLQRRRAEVNEGRASAGADDE
ncbi:VacJ family lipoprotein [Pseudacidovorax intermedius]|uniref:MlaA family lipoprotein n=1 Tax=Pseudacidovorax intermedius TaxID=433924 RepID=UPI0009E92B36|nr:VacJ family lipoprotein [Pseudacidovorax intermedius]